jgi:hypothetical protein
MFTNLTHKPCLVVPSKVPLVSAVAAGPRAADLSWGVPGIYTNKHHFLRNRAIDVSFFEPDTTAPY